MESRKRELVLLAALLLLSAHTRPAPETGTASGTLTLNGTRFALMHAYASARPGFFDKTTEDVRVLLSDVAIPDSALTDVFDLIHLARDGKAHVVEVLLNSTGTPIGGGIFAEAFGGNVSLAGPHRFEPTRFDSKAIAGRMWMNEPSSFVNVTFHYDATFSAPIPRPPTEAEIAATLTTPPALAASAYLAAVRTGDLSAVRRLLNDAAAADYSGADAANRLAQAQADIPPDSRVVHLRMQSDGTALADVEGHEQGIVIGAILKMVQERGVWKVGK